MPLQPPTQARAGGRPWPGGGSSHSPGPADSHCKSVLWELAASAPSPPTVDKNKSDMCSKVNQRSRPPPALTSIVLEQGDAKASTSPRQRWMGWSLVLGPEMASAFCSSLFFTVALSTQNSEFCLQTKVHSWSRLGEPSFSPVRSLVANQSWRPAALLHICPESRPSSRVSLSWKLQRHAHISLRRSCFSSFDGVSSQCAALAGDRQRSACNRSESDTAQGNGSL